jgi:predicted nucleic acid-binding protein
VSYLLDTNVLSETQKRRPDRRVMRWLAQSRSADLFVSVLTIGEVRRGATNLRDRGDVQRADGLERWVAEIAATFRDRVVPVSIDIANVWGNQSPSRSPGIVDGLIAATALVHGLTIVTRNTRDFERTGVRVVNPFAAA